MTHWTTEATEMITTHSWAVLVTVSAAHGSIPREAGSYGRSRACVCIAGGLSRFDARKTGARSLRINASLWNVLTPGLRRFRVGVERSIVAPHTQKYRPRPQAKNTKVKTKQSGTHARLSQRLANTGREA